MYSLLFGIDDKLTGYHDKNYIAIITMICMLFEEITQANVKTTGAQTRPERM